MVNHGLKNGFDTTVGGVYDGVYYGGLEKGP